MLGQLLGIRLADAKAFLLCAVKWLSISVDFELRAGVHILPGIPQGAAIRAVTDIIKRAAAGLSGVQHSSKGTKPKGVLFFAAAGPESGERGRVAFTEYNSGICGRLAGIVQLWPRRKVGTA